MEINNQIILKGKVSEEIKLSHESFNEKFYITTISTERISGEIDYIKVVISEKDLKDLNINLNDNVQIEGQIRSYNHYNKANPRKRKLVINVFAKEIKKIDKKELEEKSETNKVILKGYICRKPTYRKTPFGREISDILIAVNRNNKKSDYLPLIAWGRDARFASKLEIGEVIEIKGRFQSRDYIKVLEDGEETKKRAYEISVMELTLFEEE